MENQGNNFFGGSNAFGVESTSIIDDQKASLLFDGGSPATEPSKVTPIKKDKKDPASITPLETEEKKEPETPTLDPLTPDDILGSAEEPEETAAPTKPTDEEKPITEQVAAEADTFASLTRNLIDLGIFSAKENDEMPKTGEEFRDRWLNEKAEQVNGEIYNFLMSKHGDEGLKVFNDIFVKGMNPKEYLDKYTSIKNLEDLDLTIEDNQKSVFREAYRRQGLTDDKIEKRLQRAIDYGDLEDEAKDLFEVVLQQDRESMEEMLEQESERAQLESQQKQQYLNNLNTILAEKLKEREFDGIPVTEKEARETIDYLYTEKWQLPSGEKLTDFDKDILELRDPKNHALKVKLGLLLRKKLDLSKIKTNVISKETNRMFNDLVTKEKVAKRNNPIMPSSTFADGL